ncbi:hypothetical protein AR457_33425 [Streptomyces agglomeratus]|uniref:Uncharacterized protein n=1 Tax=Streptomyces agglomeratus TaxID=285458 RepID=A0A1E5PGE3_9ACTN|nr:hypothetical protein [Streptomyces agglomeratus]OEJ28628.1 hypothetical protein AS594_33310 [Streptomyces agglomeratus]OEJ37307.1 hypothetical protein BGK70_03245 [Streptomyces agglomeratus]OEJ48311.1 hypothetical protein AR457_33425 [Streptomyces agglomeratus]OEJ49852.1 hypothetical protein BGK72_02750 [Streptomyces agglomeratus]OEJ57163.1 hypothetical protein BGM19_03340 [Streptomyces agglomeratus]
MRTPQYAVRDGAYWLDAGQAPCSLCTDLLSPDAPRGELEEQVPAPRQRLGELFTGETTSASAVRAVMIIWFTATTALAVVLALPRCSPPASSSAART